MVLNLLSFKIWQKLFGFKAKGRGLGKGDSGFWEIYLKLHHRGLMFEEYCEHQGWVGKGKLLSS